MQPGWGLAHVEFFRGVEVNSHFAFFDESYSQDAYFIAAFVVPRESLGQLDENVRGLLYSLSSVLGATPTELHAHELMSGVGAWAPIAHKTRLKISILRRTLRLVHSIPGALVFAEGTDVQRLNTRYRYPENPHTTTLRHLLEKVDTWASGAGTKVGLVADEIATKNEHQVELRAYKELGTGGYFPRVIRSLEGPIQFLDSRESPGLQVADTLAYLFRRRDFLVRTGSHSRNIVIVDGLLREIAGNIQGFRPGTPYSTKAPT